MLAVDCVQSLYSDEQIIAADEDAHVPAHANNLNIIIIIIIIIAKNTVLMTIHQNVNCCHILAAETIASRQ